MKNLFIGGPLDAKWIEVDVRANTHTHAVWIPPSIAAALEDKPQKSSRIDTIEYRRTWLNEDVCIFVCDNANGIAQLLLGYKTP